MASFGTVPQLADYLTNGYWAWRGEISHHWASNIISVGFVDLTEEEETLALAALNAWHDIANINFVVSEDTADIYFTNLGEEDASTFADWDETGNMTVAFVNISSDFSDDKFIGGYFYQAYVHEVGHAFGLGHQGPYNATASYGADNIFTNDTWHWSVMSYFPQEFEQVRDASTDFVATPQVADIAAIQSLYGAREDTRTGDTVYGFNSNAGPPFDFSLFSDGPPAIAIYDNGGFDVLDCSGYSQNQGIDLRPGRWSSIGGYNNNVLICDNTVIESAIGGRASDQIHISELNSGGQIDGGPGLDLLFMDFAEAATGITFKLRAPKLVSTGLGGMAITGVETIFFTGSDHNDIVEGSAGGDWIDGKVGNDQIWGGKGADILVGGEGRNVIIGGLGDDQIESAGNDRLVGGLGGDGFILGIGRSTLDYNNVTESPKGDHKRDLIEGFTHGTDQIDLRTIDANTELAGNQSFRFIGTQSFHRTAGELHYLKRATFFLVEADVDGDGRADLQIEIHDEPGQPPAKLTAQDFDL